MDMGEEEILKWVWRRGCWGCRDESLALGTSLWSRITKYIISLRS